MSSLILAAAFSVTVTILGLSVATAPTVPKALTL
jgi:hypothetical protein